MNIQAIYLIGSQSKSSYGTLVKCATSGNLTHVAIVFYVGNNGQKIPPIETSTINQSQWIMDNSINTSGSMTIFIESLNYDIELENGFYVFETTNDISQHLDAPPIIKAPNQISGCVITPLETYRLSYERNVIIKMKKKSSVLKLLIKQYWGKPYGIDSIINNLNSNLSMVCTQLTSRYVNPVYSKNFSMFSPTKFVFEVGKLHNDSDFKEDDFLDKKFLPHHYLFSIIPIISIFLMTFFIFMYVSTNQLVITNKDNWIYNRNLLWNNEKT